MPVKAAPTGCIEQPPGERRLVTGGNVAAQPVRGSAERDTGRRNASGTAGTDPVHDAELIVEPTPVVVDELVECEGLPGGDLAAVNRTGQRVWQRR